MGKAALQILFGLGTFMIVYSIITLIFDKPTLYFVLPNMFYLLYVIVISMLAVIELGEEWLKVYKQKNTSE